MTVVPVSESVDVLLSAFTMSEPALRVSPPVKELLALDSSKEPSPFLTTDIWKPGVPSTASASTPLKIELSVATLLTTNSPEVASVETPKITLDAEPPEVKRLLTNADPWSATITGKEVLLDAGMIFNELLVPSLRKLSPSSNVPAVAVMVPEKTESEPPFTGLLSAFKPRSPRPFLSKSSFAPRSK